MIIQVNAGNYDSDNVLANVPIRTSLSADTYENSPNQIRQYLQVVSIIDIGEAPY